MIRQIKSQRNLLWLKNDEFSTQLIYVLLKYIDLDM